MSGWTAAVSASALALSSSSITGTCTPDCPNSWPSCSSLSVMRSSTGAPMSWKNASSSPSPAAGAFQVIGSLGSKLAERPACVITRDDDRDRRPGAFATCALERLRALARGVARAMGRAVEAWIANMVKAKVVYVVHVRVSVSD